MLDIINNALANNNYYVTMYPNHIYIYNYQKIIAFNHDIIIIGLIDITLKVKGEKMLIKKMHEHELLIEGIILGVSYE